MTNSEKFGAIIVTYNPEMDVLLDNIKNVRKQVGKLIIVDNGSENLKNIRENFSDIEIIELKQNVGIAKALNIGIQALQDLGFRWTFTLDQDSVLPSKATHEFTNYIQQHDMDNVAILAPRVFDRGWDDKQIEAETKKIKGKYQLIKRAITSGNLVKISAWKEVGGFDERLFIDWVDFDFDKKLELAGYQIVQINSVIMNHEIGKAIHPKILHRLLLHSKNRQFRDHSPFRQYYFYRNQIIYFRKYNSGISKYIMLLRTTLSIRDILLYSKPRSKKFVSAIKGLIDGFSFKI